MPSLNDIETPAFVVNEGRALGNIRKFQDHCDAQGLALRPHIKTHKTIHFAKAQVEAGAANVGELVVRQRLQRRHTGAVDECCLVHGALFRLLAVADDVDV